MSPKKNFEVLVTREVTESATVKVQADTPEEAAELAIQKVNDQEAEDWAKNDNYYDDAYLGAGVEEDVTEIGEVEP